MARTLAPFNRRTFIRGAACATAGLLVDRSPLSAASYRVGVGHDTDPYAATVRAVQASSQWPSDDLAGRTVIIKPNLILPFTADTGITTDPEVVRALVDLALEDGAAQIRVVEGGPYGAHFGPCGYQFLEDYDPLGRVQLVDLNQALEVLVPVPSGLSYGSIYLPEMIADREMFLISAAKMKTHVNTFASLSLKNLLGLPRSDRYRTDYSPYRFGLHERGISQIPVDLELARPMDFSVVDAIWAMEGNGPARGNPVRMDMVLAGANGLAVDRVCLEAMEIAPRTIQHLEYGAVRGLGPAFQDPIEVTGDTFTSHPFLAPDTPPVVGYPLILPSRFSPSRGEQVEVVFTLRKGPCLVRINVVQGTPESGQMTQVRELFDWTPENSGIKTTSWDGRDDGGQVVAPGGYAIQINAAYEESSQVNTYALAWSTVIP